MKNIFKKITSEKIIISIIIYITIFLAKFPTIYNAFNTPKNYWFIGHTSWFDSWDIQVYESYIRFGQSYGIFLQNTFTTIPHSGVLIFQFYTIIGIINRIFNLSIPLIFQISSVIADIILLLTIYVIIRSFFKERLFRISAFIIAAIGGGLGWVPGLFNGSDVTSAGFTTINAFERGHEAISTALLLLSVFLFIKYLKNRNMSILIIAVILALTQCAIHTPFILFYAIIGTAIAFIDFSKNKHKISFFYPATISLIFTIYYLIFLADLPHNAGFAGVINQQLPHVSLNRLAIGIGLIFPFLIWGYINILKDKSEIFYVKIVFFIQALFLFLPVGFTLYYLKGLHFWAVIIAIYSFEKLKINHKYKIVLLVILTSLTVITRLFIFNQLLHPNIENPFMFLRVSENNALQYLTTLPLNSNILSLYRIGNYIPAYSDNKVYFGHKFQTPNGDTKLKKALNFYVGLNETQQKKFLKLNSINYIYYGLEESSWRYINKLKKTNPFPYFKIIYNKNGIIIYKV